MMLSIFIFHLIKQIGITQVYLNCKQPIGISIIGPYRKIWILSATRPNFDIPSIAPPQSIFYNASGALTELIYFTATPKRSRDITNLKVVSQDSINYVFPLYLRPFNSEW